MDNKFYRAENAMSLDSEGTDLDPEGSGAIAHRLAQAGPAPQAGAGAAQARDLTLGNPGHALHAGVDPRPGALEMHAQEALQPHRRALARRQQPGGAQQADGLQAGPFGHAQGAES